MQLLLNTKRVSASALLAALSLSAAVVSTASLFTWGASRGLASENNSSINLVYQSQDQPTAIHASIDISITNSSDDAEENRTSGKMVLNSGDLEMIEDSVDYGLQVVGLRFVGIAIPQGATIENAFLKFKVDESDSVTTSLVIQGHALDNAQTFTTIDKSITSRATTSATVPWNNIPAWSMGSTQQSPNLTTIVQELVNRPGWQKGGAISFDIRGNGRRTAVSFDGSSRSAPVLHIEWLQGGGNTPTPSQTPQSTATITATATLVPPTLTATSTTTPAPSATATATATSTPSGATECRQTGSIVREFWSGIANAELTNLLQDPRFPNDPTGQTQLSQLESPSNIGDNYGALIRGYLCPKKSGGYTFWIAGDNQSQLWLSLTNKPEDKVFYALVPDWTGIREWDKFPEQQQTKVITLSAGSAYYIEVLHKEGVGDDNLAVAWSGPELAQQIIDGVYLAPVATRVPKILDKNVFLPVVVNE